MASIVKFRDMPINVPEWNRKMLLDKNNLSVPKGSERIDNIANVVYGNNLLYYQIMDNNNIGFLFDTSPSKKLIVKW